MKRLRTSTIILLTIAVAIIAAANVYSQSEETIAALVIFEPDTLFVDAAPLINDLNLNLYQDKIRHEYTIGDRIGSEPFYKDEHKENIDLFLANEWQRIDRNIDSLIDEWQRVDNLLRQQNKNPLNNTEQRERYIRDKALFDQTIKGCWTNLSCPSITITRFNLASITEEQLKALEESHLVREVRILPSTRYFLPLYTDAGDFDWKPQLGTVRTFEEDDGRRIIRTTAFWSQSPALDSVRERGFFSLRLALNTTLTSPLGLGTYIDPDYAIYDSNFPDHQEFLRRDNNLEFEVIYGVRGFQLQNLQPNVEYYGLWEAPPHDTAAEKDNGDLTIEVGNAINCILIYCWRTTAICEVNDQEEDNFGITPIPGTYVWTDNEVPDQQCKAIKINWLPFFN